MPGDKLNTVFWSRSRLCSPALDILTGRGILFDAQVPYPVKDSSGLSLLAPQDISGYLPTTGAGYDPMVCTNYTNEQMQRLMVLY